MTPALLALVGCASDLRILEDLVYRATDPDTGLSEDLHVEGTEARVRDVRSQCTAALAERTLADLYRRAAPLFEDPPADALSCTRCEQRQLALSDVAGDRIEVRWSGDLDGEDHAALDRLVGELDELWERVVEVGECGGAPFTL